MSRQSAPLGYTLPRHSERRPTAEPSGRETGDHGEAHNGGHRFGTMITPEKDGGENDTSTRAGPQGVPPQQYTRCLGKVPSTHRRWMPEQATGLSTDGLAEGAFEVASTGHRGERCCPIHSTTTSDDFTITFRLFSVIRAFAGGTIHDMTTTTRHRGVEAWLGQPGGGHGVHRCGHRGCPGVMPGGYQLLCPRRGPGGDNAGAPAAQPPVPSGWSVPGEPSSEAPEAARSEAQRSGGDKPEDEDLQKGTSERRPQADASGQRGGDFFPLILPPRPVHLHSTEHPLRNHVPSPPARRP